MLFRKNKRIKSIKLSIKHHHNIKFYKRNDSELYTEKVPGYKAMWFLYYNLFGKQLLFTFVARKLTQVLYGKLMDTRWSKRMIKTFIHDYNIPMEQYEKSARQYKSFNDFFIRKKISIDHFQQSDTQVLCSPCDGKILVYPDLREINHFYIKDQSFSFDRLLESNDFYNDYSDGSMAIIRLCPSDYHRFHFPSGGFAEHSFKVKGKYYSVSPVALRKRAGIFWENKREVTVVTKSEFSEYLYIEVGATCVGSIIQTYNPGKPIYRGQEKGYFKFGGSTVILVFKKNIIQFDEDLIRNTNEGYETEICVGEFIGKHK